MVVRTLCLTACLCELKSPGRESKGPTVIASLAHPCKAAQPVQSLHVESQANVELTITEARIFPSQLPTYVCSRGATKPHQVETLSGGYELVLGWQQFCSHLAHN